MEITCKYEESVDNIKKLMSATPSENNIEHIKDQMQEMKYWHQVLAQIDIRRDELI